ncbi:cell growth-regulating nucleolar protein-like [Saccostrea echinata]|uniref:cell growth-regulating nucleolar protein-like n=1 Tax=Saccostrea echinata TaxID=191078 RepID=UPI002A83D4F3|nr:cell growth-regulating nucleolar protein-like [Saccostrea echinata]XP_061171911.1 cell growth-regulating nucleolar protein-like [Saccostrea echinata]
MVFFSCNACGESLKKNQVEKHYTTKCRQAKSLSCIDCSKEFWGQEYDKHTKCISEEEKYSGKNYVSKSGANKGEQKQNQWLEQVHAAINGAQSDKSVLHLLHQIKDYPNIPRKQAKFKNFLKNSLRVKKESLIDEAWNLIMKHAEQTKTTETQSPEAKPMNGNHEPQSKAETEIIQKGQTKKEKKEEMKKKRKEERKRKRKADENGDVKEEEEEEKPKKKKKRKKEEHEEEDMANGDVEASTLTQDLSQDKQVEEKINQENMDEKSNKVKAKFDWEQVITEVLHKKGEITLKKLRKKVLAEYASVRGEPGSEEKILAKFMKKVNKNPRIKVHKERVKLKN